MTDFVDALIDEHGAKEDEFTVEVRGRSYRVRALKDASEMMAIERYIRKAQALLEAGSTRKLPPEWAPYRPLEPEVVRMAYYVGRLTLEPKISVEDCFKLSKTAGPLFLEIAAAVMGPAFNTAGEEEMDAIEDAKNA